MHDHYEAYWRRPGIYHEPDPMAPARQAALFSTLAAAEIDRGSWLEIGCGTGDLCALATSKGFETLGTDISEAALARARDQYPALRFARLDVENTSWFEGTKIFDVVASFEVIEHLLHPRILVAGARECLRKGGVLALTTPYHGRIKNAAISLIDFERHFAPEGDHIRFLIDRFLKSVLSEEGFEVIRIEHFGRAPFVWEDVFVAGRKR